MPPSASLRIQVVCSVVTGIRVLTDGIVCAEAEPAHTMDHDRMQGQGATGQAGEGLLPRTCSLPPRCSRVRSGNG